MTGEVAATLSTARMTAVEEIERTIRDLRRYASNDIREAAEQEAQAVELRARALQRRAKADEYERALRFLTDTGGVA